MVKIIVAPGRRGSLLLLGLLVACGTTRRGADSSDPASPSTVVKLPYERLLVLEAWGATPDDTTIAFLPGEVRSVVIRHGPPDNTVFAEAHFGAQTFAAAPVDLVRLRFVVSPGRYGLTIESNTPVGPGADITFKYPMHFAASAKARERYGSSTAYERALTVVRLEPDSQYRLLDSHRPTTDNLLATIPDTGTYLVAAPR